MALYSDPSNPLNQQVPDLHDLIDRFSEGQLDAQDYTQPDTSYVDRAHGSMAHSAGAIDYTPDEEGYIHGRAAEFATQKDLANYAKTGSLATGDNGIGAFGHKTTGPTPFVALSRDVLDHAFGNASLARGKHVEVISPGGTSAVIEIGDIGPRVHNRGNNSVLELNPAAKAILGSGDANGYRYRFID